MTPLTLIGSQSSAISENHTHTCAQQQCRCSSHSANHCCVSCKHGVHQVHTNSVYTHSGARRILCCSGRISQVISTRALSTDTSFAGIFTIWTLSTSHNISVCFTHHSQVYMMYACSAQHSNRRLQFPG
jgi:hypothetical protein